MQKSFLPLLALLALLCSVSLSAQAPARVTIRGAAVDTLGEPLEFATVMLLNPRDSSLANFTRSGEKGEFSFKNVKNSAYLLKVTYIGNLPLQQYLPPSTTEVNDLGTLRVKPISTALMEVVIREAKAPLRIKGDTIEYDATTFKVPPGSTVEDLLRRLPGIEVDADGNIKAQGKDVNRVYVDGKTFFGDDPKAATKNLGAETISKVQVYNEQSEQAKLTGIDDGKKEKALNLELKEEFKKGSFGKVTAAVGTEERWAGRGNFNRFNPKEQLSFIGYANNINQTGVNWEDYGEFKGQNSFNNNDNGDFGFNSGRRFFYFGDDEVLNNFDGRGFTDNAGAGANYNFDNKKTKFNASYFYNQTRLHLDEYGFRQTFLNESTFTNTDTTQNVDFRGTHTLGTRWEQQLDSSDVLIVKANARLSGSNTDHQLGQLFEEQVGTPKNRLDINNTADLQAWRVNSTAIYRHRFHKKGRSFAVSAGFNTSKSDGTEDLFSINRFFEATTFSDQVRQFNTSLNQTNQLKSSLLYTDALSKKWYWETFYNFTNTANVVDRQVQDPLDENRRIDSLSIYYDNGVRYQRVGSGLRYSFGGLNASVGLAAQQIEIDGSYSISEGEPLLTTPVDRRFRNVVPNVDVNYETKNNIWLGGSYTYNVNEPQLSDLQPIPNVNNPAFRTQGNPNLTPERSHNVGANLNYWNPASFSNVGVGMWGDFYDNRIVYNQTIEEIDTIGIRTTSRPENVSGGYGINSYVWSGFPIVKTKIRAELGGDFQFGESPAFVNGVKNTTNSQGFGVRPGLNFTPSTRLIANVNGNLNYNRIRYSIQSEQNQNILNYGVDVSAKWQVISKTFVESNLDYSVYKNDRFGFNQTIPIWNASIRRILGKNNRVEMRLAAFDILNKRVNINQFGSQNFVTRRIAPTLARYFMVSATYNVRGYENKLNKNNWW